MSPLELTNAPAWFTFFLNLSFQAALLTGLVYAGTKTLGRWMSPNWRALLWFLVIARLLLPIAPPSAFSLQNLFIAAKPASSPTAPTLPPSIKFNIQDLGRPIPSSAQLSEPFDEPFPTPAPEPKPFPTGLVLALIWAIGATLSFTILIARSLLLRHRLSASRIEPTASILQTLAACQTALGLKYPVRVSASQEVAAPALTGLFPARLIVPQSFAGDTFSAEQIRRIFLHELAHIKQGHLLLHWLALAARCAHWFNPLVHFAAARLRQECELAADAAALENATQTERAAYGETILLALAQTTAPSSALALGMAEQARHLEQRLRALTTPRVKSHRLLGALAAAALALSGLSGADTTPPKTDTPATPFSAQTNPVTNLTNETKNAADEYVETIHGITVTNKIDRQKTPLLKGANLASDPKYKIVGETVWTQKGVLVTNKTYALKLPAGTNLADNPKFEELDSISITNGVTVTNKAYVALTEPSRLMGRVGQALELLYQEKRKEAEQILNEVLELDPNFQFAKITLDKVKNVNLKFNGIQNRKTGNITEAAFDAMIKSNATRISLPDRPPASAVVNVRPNLPIEQSRRLILSGRISEAENLLQTAINSGGVDIQTPEPQRKILVSTNDTGNGWNQPRGREFLPYSATNRVGIGEPRQKLLEKLASIRIDEFPITKDTPLGEVIKELSREITARGPQKRGINLIISQSADRDPITGLTLQPEVDVENFTIKFNPPIRDLTLGQFLDAIVMVARPPAGAPPDATLKYSVEDYAIVFSQRLPETNKKLYTRTFKVDADAYKKVVEKYNIHGPGKSVVTQTNQLTGRAYPVVKNDDNISTEINQQLRAFFSAAGLDFPILQPTASREEVQGQKAFFYSDTRGTLFVRASLTELDTIEKALQEIKMAKAETAPEPPKLYTRTFKVEPNAFKRGMEEVNFPGKSAEEILLANVNKPANSPGPNAGNASVTTVTNVSQIQHEIRAFFSAAGVDFPTNAIAGQPDSTRKAMFYNDRKGVLFVRAPLADLDVIEQALHVINAQPAQILFTVKLAEVAPEREAQVLEKFAAAPEKIIVTTNEYISADIRGVKIAGTNTAAKLQLEASRRLFKHNPNPVISTSTVNRTTSRLLTEPQTREFEKWCHDTQGVDFITTPSVTTLVDRQARISIEQTKTFVFPDALHRPEGSEIGAAQIPLGPVIDVFATRVTDAGISIKTIVAITQFLGYTDTKTDAKGDRLALPNFRVRATEAIETVPPEGSLLVIVDRDEVGTGQTVPVLADIPLIGRLFRTETKENKPRQSIFIITPTVIDPAGNRVKYWK